MRTTRAIKAEIVQAFGLDPDDVVVVAIKTQMGRALDITLEVCRSDTLDDVRQMANDRERDWWCPGGLDVDATEFVPERVPTRRECLQQVNRPKTGRTGKTRRNQIK